MDRRAALGFCTGFPKSTIGATNFSLDVYETRAEGAGKPLHPRSKRSVVPRPGHPQVFIGVDWGIADANFVVEMRSGAASGGANVADGVAAAHALSCDDSES